MPLRTLVLITVLGLLAVFTAVNWSVISAPTTLSLVFASVQAPLGLVMLGVVVLMTIVFLTFVAYLEASDLVAMRRQARELISQREIADKAEASRFTELRTYIEEALQKAWRQREQDHATLLERIDQLEQSTRGSLEQGANSVAASLGEMEDRLERLAGERNVSNVR